MTYRVTRRARRDILGIWRYIAEDNERAADRFIDLLTRHFQVLGDNPRARRRRGFDPVDYRQSAQMGSRSLRLRPSAALRLQPASDRQHRGTRRDIRRR
jgi:plasmid stabilization system protein ParE